MLETQIQWPVYNFEKLAVLHLEVCSDVIDTIMKVHDQKIGELEEALRNQINEAPSFESVFEDLDTSIQAMWSEIAVASFVSGYKLGSYHEQLRLARSLKCRPH